MSDLVPGIRIAVRALVLRDRHLLVQHKVYDDGSERLALPGGAPDTGETLREGLLRECQEEIGAEVTVRDLVHVADYFKARDTTPPTRRQHVELVFRCDVPAGYTPTCGSRPDKHQRAVLWLDLDAAESAPLWPRGMRAIAERVATGTQREVPVYLGLLD